MPPEKKLIVLAIGGNSIISDPAHTTVPEQYDAVEETCGHVAELLQSGHRMVITHGNGPQVGFILRRSELAAAELHRVPLDSCVADTQGALGYHLQRGMFNQMQSWSQKTPVATLVTQVLVERDDPAMENPTKPIGSFLEEETARERRRAGWQVVEDSGRGFRRVVPSPRPTGIVEIEAIRKLVKDGFMVIAAGGGGIPVTIGSNGELVGVEAVIDKDLASSLLARELGADLLLISTLVERAFLHYGKPEQQALDRMTVGEAKAHIADGQFLPGSMLPKIQSMVEFVEVSGKAAVLTNPSNVVRALSGEAGTWVVP